MKTQQVLQQVMKKKKKKKTSRKCYYVTYYLMRGALILLPCLQVTYSFNSVRCFTSLCRAFESLSPFNTRLLWWWWLVLKLVTGASKVHKLVFLWCVEFVGASSHKKKSILKLWTRVTRFLKNVMILGITWRTHGNLRLHLGTSHGTHWEPTWGIHLGTPSVPTRVS
jgi:hypothetical protein